MSEAIEPVVLRMFVDGIDAASIVVPGKGCVEVRLDGDTADLRALFVDERYRRHGIGSALLRTAVALARERGMLAISWTCKKKNVGALQFYARHGAKIFMSDADEFWMSINLQSGATPPGLAFGRPQIVCLCGARRHADRIEAYREFLARKGVIVLGPDWLTKLSLTDRRRMRDLHQRKIDVADEVFVVNVDGYIGQDTHAEIGYAKCQGKKVTLMEPLK